MATVFHHIPVNAVLIFRQFDGLNFDSPAGMRQKHQNFPQPNFMLYGTVTLVEEIRVRLFLKI